MISELFINVAASVILQGCGFVFGEFREKRLARAKNLEEQDKLCYELNRDHAAV